MTDQHKKSLGDFTMPQVTEIQSSIRKPAITAMSFEIKPSTIQMIQNSVQFGGLPNDDPNDHLMSFLEFCDTFKYDGVSDDAVRLLLFPFTLRDKAKSWLHSLPPGSIITWNDLAQKFLAKFFPPTKIAKLRNDIISFVQHDSESLYEAWERYKDLLRRCPHHGIPKWFQVQTFYNGLFSTTRTTIDAVAGGALMTKNLDEAYYDLLEIMAANNYQWPSARVNQPRAVGRLDNDTFTTLVTQMATLTKKIEAFETQNVWNVSIVCDLCSGNHPVHHCPINAESVQYVANYTRQQGNNSNYYHQGVRNPPNQSWSNNQAQSYAPRQLYQSGFQNQSPPQQERESKLEELLSRVLEENALLRKNQEVAIRNLETQVRQLANAINTRPQGALPSDTVINPRGEGKEQYNAVTVRSGKELLDADGGNLKITNPDKNDDNEDEQKRDKHEDDEQKAKKDLAGTSKQNPYVPGK